MKSYKFSETTRVSFFNNFVVIFVLSYPILFPVKALKLETDSQLESLYIIILNYSIKLKYFRNSFVSIDENWCWGFTPFSTPPTSFHPFQCICSLDWMKWNTHLSSRAYLCAHGFWKISSLLFPHPQFSVLPLCYFSLFSYDIVSISKVC